MMMSVLWGLGFIAAAGALAYWRVPLWAATLAAAAYLGLGHFIPGLAAVVLWLGWLIWGLILLPFNIALLRRAMFSDRVYPVLRKAMPPMSQTEREALEAGTVWWDGELFSGDPDWNKLLAAPAAKLSAEEQAFLDGPVEELCAMLDDWKITHEDYDLPPEVWRHIREKGFFGMIIPKEYGGLGFSALAHSAVVMKIATRSISAAVTVMVPNSLGPAELLLHYGTEAQKKHYLTRLARGQEVPCFALTGPEAGSDASSIPDTGVVCRGEFQGREVLGVRLTWEKRYITLGPVATVLGLAFKLSDPERLLGERAELGITLALIPTDHPGVEIGERHFPLNAAFQNGPNRGKNVFIPLDWIIGGPERAGQGWRMLMECLAAGRSISLPALATGAGKLVCRATGGYARLRRQFKTPIGRFEGVEEALARMAGHTYAMDAARTLTAGAVDAGEKPSVISAIVKYQLTEHMRRVVNDAMDVQGGSAICMGPRNYLARAYQSVPISITVEGANILTRSLIIFGQGAVRCHPYVLKEMRALAREDKARGAEEFDGILRAHIGFALRNAARALWLGLTGARFASVPVSGPARRYFQHLTRASAAFALMADVAMLSLGGALKRKEKLSGRFADILGQMYLASAALKRFEEQGRPAGDLPLMSWACEEALHGVRQGFDGLLANFPNRFVARALRWLIFPLGGAWAPPSDALGHRAASLLLAPSNVRDRLTAGMFVPVAPHEPLARIEHALALTVRAEEAEKKIEKAIRAGALAKTSEETLYARAMAENVVSATEVVLIRRAAEARKEVIKVDAFPPDCLKRRGQHG